VGQLSLSLAAIAGGAYFILSHKDQPRGAMMKGAPVFFALLTWFCTDLVGLLAIGRFYTHYLLQLVPPASLLPPFILSQFRGRVVKGILTLSLVTLTVYLSTHFAADMRGLAQANWIPAQVRQSTAVADVIRRNSRDDDRIFFYNTYSLDIFFLSQRL